MTSTGSARYEGDTWDLASSVGVTATMVAAARAMATRADNPLINDPFAEPLVRAVGVDLLTRLATGETSPADLDDDPERPIGAIAQVADNMAVRTRFFDEYFIDATQAGIKQAVILASGLDSRAYRLPWPADTVVYEVDQPQVIEFKSRTLADLDATPTADRRVVAIDLREDWPAALRAAGFDPTQPTAWSAEGLLGYLPPEAQDRLLDTVTELSAPGSRIATESSSNVNPGDEDRDEGADAGHVRALACARLRYRHERAGLLRRPQRGRALPIRPWLAADEQSAPGSPCSQRTSANCRTKTCPRLTCSTSAARCTRPPDGSRANDPHRLGTI